MTGNHWAIGSMILAVSLFVLALRCIPEPRVQPESTPTRLPLLTATPTVWAEWVSTPTRVPVTPIPPLVIDPVLLNTRVPTGTPTPTVAPSATSTVNATPATQKG